MMHQMKSAIVAAVFTAFCLASAAASAAEAAQASSAPVGVVNINTATAAELSLLPGIGPSKAEAIVKFRASNPFKQVDQITRVKGIGKKSFLAMKPYLAVEGPTTLKTKVKTAK